MLCLVSSSLSTDLGWGRLVQYIRGAEINKCMFFTSSYCLLLHQYFIWSDTPFIYSIPKDPSGFSIIQYNREAEI